MARSKGDCRGKRINGEISAASGKPKIGVDGYYAKCHDDRVGSPRAKRAAKRAVSRARRRAMTL